MRIKNKMKDFEVESKEWWEVVKEYFTKELEKNLAQHKVDERIMKYKLEAYKKKFQILCMVVQEVQKYSAKMRRLKQGPVE
jgi:hypothetical protein